MYVYFCKMDVMTQLGTYVHGKGISLQCAISNFYQSATPHGCLFNKKVCRVGGYSQGCLGHVFFYVFSTSAILVNAALYDNPSKESVDVHPSLVACSGSKSKQNPCIALVFG